jgi:hypothetical protein
MSGNLGRHGCPATNPLSTPWVKSSASPSALSRGAAGLRPRHDQCPRRGGVPDAGSAAIADRHTARSLPRPAPTAAERARLLTLIDARVSLRLPAPYLVGAAYMHGVRFHADRRALIPRSFIGDMLADGVLPIGDAARCARARSLHRLGLPRHPGGAHLPARAHRCRGLCRPARWRWRGATWRAIGWAIASRSIAAISSRRCKASATT